jgi:hypothetical protein
MHIVWEHSLCGSNDAFLPFVFFLLVSLFEDLALGDCPDRLFCGVFFWFVFVFYLGVWGGAGEGALFLIVLYLTAQIILLVLATASSNFARAIRDVVL